MTPVYLQEALVSEIKEIFKDDLFKDTTGAHSELNVYEQQLPVVESDEEPEQFPYVIVRIDTGKRPTDEDPNDISILVLIGMFNDSLENNGHKDVLNIIDKIKERFEKNPLLDHRYTFHQPSDWALQDEESFPYFFGAMNLNFYTPAVQKEDRYA
jgi:hypothetical protein